METARTGLSKAQMDINSLQDAQKDQEAANTRLKEKLSRLEVKLSNYKPHPTQRCSKNIRVTDLLCGFLRPSCRATLQRALRQSSLCRTRSEASDPSWMRRREKPLDWARNTVNSAYVWRTQRGTETRLNRPSPSWRTPNGSRRKPWRNSTKKYFYFLIGNCFISQSICRRFSPLDFSLSVRISERDLKGRDPGSQSSAGGAEGANTKRGAGGTSSWKWHKIRAGTTPTRFKATGGRSMKLLKIFSLMQVFMIRKSLLGMNFQHSGTSLLFRK